VLKNKEEEGSMAHPAAAKLMQLFEHRGIAFRRIEHEACRTSEESAQARAIGGGGLVCGAKALVVKMSWRGAGSEFNVLVLPGPARIDAKRLSDHLPELKKFRFASPAELAELTVGLEPGMMPPFGRQIFDAVNRLYVDSALLDHDLVGFNAAALTSSIVIRCRDYLNAADPTEIFSFAALRDELLPALGAH
jgi:Ala-tRNA(Pro) deacylase